MRLWQLRVFGGQRPNHAQVGRLVGTAGEKAIHLHEGVLATYALGIEKLLEHRTGLVDPLRGHQRRGKHLEGVRRRLELIPKTRGGKPGLGFLRLIGDLDGAAGDARIASSAREREVGFRGERQIAALHRNLADEEIVKRRLAEIFGGRDVAERREQRLRRGIS